MTFSVIAKSKETLGVGVVSGSTAVRRRVPWVKSRVGAIATQGYTETRYGRKGLKLLEEGVEPKPALEKLLQEDSSPERRQVTIIDSSGKKAVHTGSSCPQKRFSKTREKCIALGNLLESEKTVSAMAEAFGKRKGKLSTRIIKALEAGERAGGDRRGDRTAALLLKGREEIDIGVDKSSDPLEVLKEKFEKQF